LYYFFFFHHSLFLFRPARSLALPTSDLCLIFVGR
jgi:hypothetical protein